MAKKPKNPPKTKPCPACDGRGGWLNPDSDPPFKRCNRCGGTGTVPA